MPLTSFVEFQGIRGTQAGDPQYATVWSLSMVLRMTDESLTRTLADTEQPTDDRFIRDLADRFAADAETALPQTFLLGVLGPIEFVPIEPHSNLGAIRMDPTNRIEILDGVHRLAALRRAALPAGRIADLTVPVLITPIANPGELVKRRAAIANPDPASNAVQSDRRIDLNLHRQTAKDSVALSPFLTRAVDLNRVTLALRSNRLFTLSTYARACRPLLEGQPTGSAQRSAEHLAAYWQVLGDLIPDWRRFASSQIAASELREQTVLTSASMLTAFGLIGARLLAESPDDWQARVRPLGGLDWKKESLKWQGTIVTDGRRRRGDDATHAAFRLLLDTCGLCATAPNGENGDNPSPAERRVSGEGTNQ